MTFIKFFCNIYVIVLLFMLNLSTVVGYLIKDLNLGFNFYISIFFLIWFSIDIYRYFILKSIDEYLQPIER